MCGDQGTKVVIHIIVLEVKGCTYRLVVIRQLLLMCGDVELNPGPLDGEFWENNSCSINLPTRWVVLQASPFYVKERQRVWRMNLHSLVPRSIIWTTNEIAASSHVT